MVIVPPRIVMAAGFSTIAVACWMAAHVDSSWSGTSFRIPELVFAAGVGWPLSDWSRIWFFSPRNGRR